MHLNQVSKVIAPPNVAALLAPMLTKAGLDEVRFNAPGEFAVSRVTLPMDDDVIGALPG